jgi:hypothetical protein
MVRFHTTPHLRYLSPFAPILIYWWSGKPPYTQRQVYDHYRAVNMLTSVLLFLVYLSGPALAKYTCNAANAANNQPATSDSQTPSTGYPSDGSVPAFTPSYAPAIEAIGSDVLEASLPGRVRLRARSAALQSRGSTNFECEDTEACILGNNFLACVDLETNDFQDTFGGKGNLGSDVYTLKNGVVTTISETATALPTVEATKGASTIPAAAAATTTTGTGVATASANVGSSKGWKGSGAAELAILIVLIGAAGALS